MKVAIVGAGLIGTKRAQALDRENLVMVADVQKKRAETLAQQYGAKATDRWQDCLSEADTVVISTTHQMIPEIAIAALQAHKHVLIEKPGARNVQELEAIEAAAKNSKGVLRVGFNHRFHPAFQRMKNDIDDGRYGKVMYIRARYGHGGRLGYETEWRAKPEISGGGELLDQGVHLIDLCRWLAGDFRLEYGLAKTFFWKMPVDDNGFLLLRSGDGTKSAFLHASCTEWKNLFDFEVFCETAKLQVSGLGRSYGTEEYLVYRMKPEMGPPEIDIEQFKGEDRSWEYEWQAFMAEIERQRSDIGRIGDALAAMQIVRDVYRISKFGVGL